MANVPDYVLEHVALHLGCYAEYRRQIAAARDLGVRFGDGRRYVDDTRRNRGAELRSSATVLREFTRLAKRNGVDPSAVMRQITGREILEPAPPIAQQGA